MSPPPSLLCQSAGPRLGQKSAFVTGLLQGGRGPLRRVRHHDGRRQAARGSDGRFRCRPLHFFNPADFDRNRWPTNSSSGPGVQRAAAFTAQTLKVPTCSTAGTPVQKFFVMTSTFAGQVRKPAPGRVPNADAIRRPGDDHGVHPFRIVSGLIAPDAGARA